MRIIQIGRLAAWFTAASIAVTTTLSVMLVLWYIAGQISVGIQGNTISMDRLLLIVIIAAVLPWITMIVAVIQRVRTGLRLGRV